MTQKTWRVGLFVAISPLWLFLLAGCGEGTRKTEVPPGKTTQVALAAEKKEHDHGEWWCDEHGVPEEVCGQCNAKLRAKFKAKGDWCKEHDRPESQCFIRHPELKERFAAQYRAKYGKEPPPTEDDEKTGKETPKKG